MQKVNRGNQQENRDSDYVQQLEDLVNTLKNEKERRVSTSEEVMTSILEKVSDI